MEGLARADPAAGLDLEQFKIDISHQEMDRIIMELEDMCETVRLTGVEWLDAERIGGALGRDLGYEDTAEFEDAIKGEFHQFLSVLPHVEMRDNEETGRKEFRMKPPVPESERRPFTMSFPIESTKDLWRAIMKSPQAVIEIPEMEFEIGADGKRHVDSIYNHIGAAIHNLGRWVSEMPAGTMTEENKHKIMDTVICLNVLLDAEKPFTIVLRDPSGLSSIKPVDDRTVFEYTDGK
eukprot:NODE_3329_length_911_cov_46.465561_g3307_i0.p1 GENE.NODE_3329_length_911_cov_46.465561_g3307_i0~~NODE_3329_length_911_cov_46.465561_g3307_i0.p1  ORF type:complete len:250 (+),score=56.32 NODE_3329_length_911_cov_46.465561_g3307_i0:44-751(+)